MRGPREADALRARALISTAREPSDDTGDDDEIGIGTFAVDIKNPGPDRSNSTTRSSPATMPNLMKAEIRRRKPVPTIPLREQPGAVMAGSQMIFTVGSFRTY